MGPTCSGLRGRSRPWVRRFDPCSAQTKSPATSISCGALIFRPICRFPPGVHRGVHRLHPAPAIAALQKCMAPKKGSSDLRIRRLGMKSISEWNLNEPKSGSAWHQFDRSSLAPGVRLVLSWPPPLSWSLSSLLSLAPSSRLHDESRPGTKPATKTNTRIRNSLRSVFFLLLFSAVRPA